VAQHNTYNDKFFDELVEKGFVEHVGVGPNAEYKLTAKADRYLDAVSFMEYLKQNTPEKIRERMGGKEIKLSDEEIIAQLFPDE
jgi:hypothetical protein